jgi:parallel beta-helix repeat protein
MSSTIRRALIGAVAGGVMLATVGLTAIPAAQAAGCPDPVLRYASSSNTLYLSAGVADLPALKAACPAAPLSTDGAGTWDLGANLVVQNGATLNIGPGVTTLRLRSDPASTTTTVVAITAQYGTINIDGAAVTSWDTVAKRPDTDPNLPSGVTASSTTRARAFVRAVSVLDADGTPRESTMNITDSRMSYLGWYASESYGVAYKARGCGHDTDAARDVCARLNVYGSQRNSTFEYNTMGTYTWGAEGMTFDRNVYANNVIYGLDPHDNSDNLTITNNEMFGNGDHGLICSQLCNGLRIVGNHSHSNGYTPWIPPTDDDPSDNQVHGIMLHRGVTDSVIQDNVVEDNPNGAGIAIFDSSGILISGNTVRKNRFGFRASVGTTDVRVQDNTFDASSSYGVYTYAGSDPVVYGSTPRPHDITFTRNALTGTGRNVANLTSSDRLSFVDNVASASAGPLNLQGSTGISWSGASKPGSGITLSAATTTNSGRLVMPATPYASAVPVTLDGTGSVDVVAPDGRLYDAGGRKVRSAIGSGTAAGSTLPLGPDLGTSPIAVTQVKARVLLDTGRLSALASGFSTTNRQVAISGGTAGATATFIVSGLTAGRSYPITFDGSPQPARTATAGGTVQFTITVPDSGSHLVAVTG